MWRELGLPGLIDVHTHFMPDNVMRKVWSYFDDLGEGVWPITYRGDDAERAELLRAFGVRRFTALNYPHRPDMAEWLNAWTADFTNRNPDCLRGATFYPERSAATYVANAIGAGTRVFKAHLQVGDYDPRDPQLTDVWGALAESGIPVVVHCGSGPHGGRFTGPEPFADVLKEHPRLTAVIAHFGSPEYTEFMDLAERYERVHLDTTMVFTRFTERSTPFPTAELPRLRRLRDKILLGTDFPNIPHRYVEQLHALRDVAPDDDWLRAVLHDNAARLFNT
ncbi:amidohydrolase [Halostreptopolyspora alba]|uniref:Amidohydrolase n=1 Tax=Halostreptopolyspora alba TaxID=2487137 RepID=A0A3N0E413_9ACTN|nr:amidohydrolase [Nocardiopsaceae bacterium YIM 96095]